MTLRVFEHNLRPCQPLLGFVSTRRFRSAFKPLPFTRLRYITHQCQTIWLIVVISLSFNKSKSTNPGAKEESLATLIWKQKKLILPDTSGHLLESAEIYRKFDAVVTVYFLSLDMEGSPVFILGTVLYKTLGLMLPSPK